MKRFDINLTIGLLRLLNKNNFSYNTEKELTEVQARKRKVVCAMDNINTVLIKGKTEEAKILLSPFNSRYNPELDYKKEQGIVKLCIDFIKFAVDFLNVSGEDEKGKWNADAIEIQTREDYPITLSNKHFEIIIAPRVGE